MNAKSVSRLRQLGAKDIMVIRGLNRISVSTAILALTTVSCTSINETSNDRLTSTTSNLTGEKSGRYLLFNAKDRFEYPKATMLLEKAVNDDSDNASLRLTLLYAYSKRSNYDQAAKQITILERQRDALKAEDAAWLDALAARTANDKPSEIRHWTNASTINPENRWTWYELASAHASAENYADAAIAAEKALAVEPDAAKWESSWIYYLHSKALFRSGQYKKSITAASAGIGNPTTLRSTYFREVIAKVAADRSIEIQPMVDEYLRISIAEKRNSLHYTQVNISLFYFELGMMEPAISHARQALALDKSAYAYWALGYALIEDGKAKEALPILESAIITDPDDAMLRGAKAWAQYRLGNASEALKTNAIAETKTKREINILSRNRAAIENAIAVPNAGPAAKIAWLD